jgi:hypothetical protein
MFNRPFFLPLKLIAMLSPETHQAVLRELAHAKLAIDLAAHQLEEKPIEAIELLDVISSSMKNISSLIAVSLL